MYEVPGSYKCRTTRRQNNAHHVAVHIRSPIKLQVQDCLKLHTYPWRNTSTSKRMQEREEQAEFRTPLAGLRAPTVPPGRKRDPCPGPGASRTSRVQNQKAMRRVEKLRGSASRGHHRGCTPRVSAYRRRAARRRAEPAHAAEKKNRSSSPCVLKTSTARCARRSFETTLKDASQATPAREDHLLPENPASKNLVQQGCFLHN